MLSDKLMNYKRELLGKAFEKCRISWNIPRFVSFFINESIILKYLFRCIYKFLKNLTKPIY